MIAIVGDQIASDGTLFIGHSENIRNVNDRFEPLSHVQGFCYRPIGAASSAAA